MSKISLPRPVKVSVILPTYNRPDHVQKCIRSALEQTFIDFELVIVDDGSETPVMPPPDNRIRLHRHDTNKGIACALNTGHALARGRYITWVSDDCWMDPEWLQSLVDGMDAAPLDVGLVYADYFDEQASRAYITTHKIIKKTNHLGASFMYRRDVMEEIGDYKTELLGAEDWDYWCRINRRWGMSKVKGKPLYHYKTLPTSIGVAHRDICSETAWKVMDSNAGQKRIALLIVATGQYSHMVKKTASSARKFFLSRHELDVFAFTNCPIDVGIGVKVIPQRPLPWPYSTMMRYQAYLGIKDELRGYDYIFAVDADMEFVADIGDEVLGDGITATQHPGFYNKPVEQLSYERRSISKACVSTGGKYYAGGFVGGSASAFIRMAESIDAGVMEDQSNGIIAEWHDESHLNKYLSETLPAVTLDPSYCYPEKWDLPFPKKLLALDKPHDAVRNKETLSVMVVSKDRPFFLEQLLMSFKDVCFDITVLYLATDEKYAAGYTHVKRKCWWVKWVEQKARGSMRPYFDKWLETASEIVMVCPDDNICTGHVDTQAIQDYMGNCDLFGFTLRLHPGIKNTQATTDSHDVPSSGKAVTVFTPPNNTNSPWGYVWEMSSTFYHKIDLIRVMNARDFHTINELESVGLQIFKSNQVGEMACFQYAPITNIFVSTNFSGSKWCVDNEVSDVDASYLFELGYEVDVKRTFIERDMKAVTHVKRLFCQVHKKLKNKAIVVVPVRNCSKYIRECCESLAIQDYKDLGVIVVDDCSTDNTAEIAEHALAGVDHIVVRGSKRRWAMQNIEWAIEDFCSDPTQVIFLVDGDDRLLVPTAISQMMKKHEKFDVVWSNYEQSDGGWPCSGPLERGPIRGNPWRMSHLRSFKRFLFQSVPRNEFKEDDGTYFKVTWDQAIMIPIGEMVPRDRVLFYPEKLYYYRIHGDNDHATASGTADQRRVQTLINARPHQAVLPMYNGALSTQRKTGSLSVVVSCFNQLREIELFLDCMFFQLKSPDAVVVADDGSTDGVCEWLEANSSRYPFTLMYVTHRHDGYRLAAIENLAARNIQSERILFTNADVLHHPGSILAHAKISGVGGGVIRSISENVSDSVERESVVDFSAIEELYKRAPGPRTNKGYIDTTNPQVDPIGVWGGNFSVPVERFESVGGFDEAFTGWGGEDNELVRRLVKSGCTAEWVLGSIAYHLDHPVRDYAKEQTGSKRYAELLNG